MTETPAVETPAPAPARAPDYIRLYAAMNGEASRFALEYAKAMLRVAPVRVIPCDGAGIWTGYEQLLLTPCNGTYVNVVACGPDAWTRTHRYQLPAKVDPVLGAAPKSSWQVDGPGKSVYEIPKPPPEVVVERFDYWTVGVRNVLFATAPPRDQWQLAAAKKFDVVIVPTNHAAYYWTKSHSCAPERLAVISAPVLTESGHAAIHKAICEVTS